ncbi:hypothetical protein [Streptomyces clavifer]|uniref:hypothetical protein n=1 Tax=Streptomyces clavifer TaxID=68188 RepID=UPI00365D5347
MDTQPPEQGPDDMATAPEFTRRAFQTFAVLALVHIRIGLRTAPATPDPPADPPQPRRTRP